MKQFSKVGFYKTWRELVKISAMAAWALCAQQLLANVRLPAIISEHMVLQADVGNRIWGKADPGETVKVTFDGQSKQTQADEKGAWAVELDPMPASSKSSSLRVSGKNNLEVKDVLVGEVWLGSGQSNMELNLGPMRDSAAEIAKANMPDVRFFNVIRSVASKPQEDCEGSWKVCSPKTAAGCSAVLFYFGTELWKARKIPVGLINSSVGGTHIHTWTPGEVFQANPKFVQPRFSVEPNAKFDNLAQYLEYQAAVYKQISHKDAETWDESWAKPEVATADWKPIMMPQRLERAFEDNFDGASWVRREVVVSSDWAGQELKVQLGETGSKVVVYWNGEKVLCAEGGAKARGVSASIPGKSVKYGTNVLAIRYFDGLGSGGPLSDTSITVQGSDMKLNKLDGQWLGKIERRLDPATNKVPPWISGLSHGTYNAMIAPITDYKCRGILWYQGEADAGDQLYDEMLEAMVQSWRQKRNAPTLPFYWVQLPNIGTKRSLQPNDHPWARMRDIQRQAMRIPHSGMVVAIDGPDPDGHPKVKRYIGERFALMARHKCYGEIAVEYSGPELRSLNRKGEGVCLTFSSTSALYLKDVNPNGFALSADGKTFHWAKAQVEGKNINLVSSNVSVPAFVRYAWDTDPHVSLFNLTGFPASPFEATVAGAEK